ncbi:hypothetical protein NEOKW01_1642 [Nematocida sp. AWRm80]|nr:hypothetical protein NEOKW01_1642 [Nematocida sp. AWRm80]
MNSTTESKANSETEKTKEENKEKKKEFNWFEASAEFGFEDIEETQKPQTLVKKTNKILIPFFLSLLGISITGIVILTFLPRNLRYIGGYSLKHIFLIVSLVSFLFLLCKLLVHAGFVFIKDHISNNKIVHNKRFKLEVTLGVWLFMLLTLGIRLEKDIPWARYILERIFACGFLTILAFVGKGLLISTFRSHFLSSSLKDKAKDVEIKEKIINTMREFCYEDAEDTADPAFAACFLVSCLQDEDSDEIGPNTNSGMEFIKGDIDTIIGDAFTTSIFQKKQLSQHEMLCLARDVFNKCSKDNESITFNDFCEIFPNAQTAVQAFLYFDTMNTKIISKKEMRDTLGHFYYDRANLQTTYNSLSNFVEVLDNLATIITIIPLILLYLILLNLPIKQIITFSFSSALILNFLISSIAKDFFSNATFILTHPFDIGDEVSIDGKDYVIYRTSLYKTEVLGVDGGKISFLNNVLGTKKLINMTRAPQKLIHISFKLDSKITTEQFKIIKKQMLIYLRENSDIFYETFTIQSETEASCKLEGLNCILVVRCKSIGNRMAKLELKIELVKCLKDILNDIEQQNALSPESISTIHASS